jgi:hypothetical protein
MPSLSHKPAETRVNACQNRDVRHGQAACESPFGSYGTSIASESDIAFLRQIVAHLQRKRLAHAFLG